MQIKFNDFELRMLLDIIRQDEIEAGTVGEYVCLQTLQSFGFLYPAGFTQYDEPKFAMTTYGREALALAASGMEMPRWVAMSVEEWKALQSNKVAMGGGHGTTT